MFDTSQAMAPTPLGATTATTFVPAEARPRYLGPERRVGTAQAFRWLVAALDEIDYGVLLLKEDARVIHANHLARSELDGSHPLQMSGQQLRASAPHEAALLADALRHAAQRGARKLLTLGEGAQRIGISVVPLVSAESGVGAMILVMLGKRQVCEALSVQGFARSHGLTVAESRVLVELCRGVPPNEIAAQLGVAISTVRTQIGAIRVKTGAVSIRALVQQVAVLPPLMGVLRGIYANHAHSSAA